MKIALLADTHAGVRGDNQYFLEYQNNFFKNTFFPALDEHDVQEIIHLGDLVDRRKFINYNTLHNLKTNFLDEVISVQYPMYVILGNHDMYYKNKIQPNALDELLAPYKDLDVEVFINPITKPTNHPMFDCLMIPWICDENYDECIDAIKTSSSKTLMGHFQISGFEMHRGQFSHEGLSADLFKNYDDVFSGHFHLKSKYNNIQYLGAPYEMTWIDYGVHKGFHIFDTETRDLEFIRNPEVMFIKLFYDDSDEADMQKKIQKMDTSSLHNKYVKVIVSNKNNAFLYDLFIERVEESGPADVKAVEDHFNMHIDPDTNLVDQAQDTLTIIKNYITGLNVDNSDDLSGLMHEVYQEALIIKG